MTMMNQSVVLDVLGTLVKSRMSSDSNHIHEKDQVENAAPLVTAEESTSSAATGTSFALIILAPTMVIVLQILAARMRNNNDERGKKGNQNSKHQYDHGRRRVQHALTGFLFYVLSFILPLYMAHILLSITTTLFYILHLARSRSKQVQISYIQHFGPLLRDHEKSVHSVPGAFWFLLGTTILVFSFTMDVARTSLLCLSFGDPMASAVGMKLAAVGGGRLKAQFRYGSKSLAGCCACFVTCVFMSMIGMGFQYGTRIWIWTGIVATFMEVLSGIVGIDDNILIPLGTGVALSFY